MFHNGKASGVKVCIKFEVQKGAPSRVAGKRRKSDHFDERRTIAVGRTVCAACNIISVIDVTMISRDISRLYQGGCQRRVDAHHFAPKWTSNM